jgi:hypothetical protein
VRKRKSDHEDLRVRELRGRGAPADCAAELPGLRPATHRLVQGEARRGGTRAGGSRPGRTCSRAVATAGSGATTARGADDRPSAPGSRCPRRIRPRTARCHASGCAPAAGRRTGHAGHARRAGAGPCSACACSACGRFTCARSPCGPRRAPRGAHAGLGRSYSATCPTAGVCRRHSAAARARRAPAPPGSDSPRVQRHGGR